MQRAGDDKDSHFNVKNDIGYAVRMGYRVYNTTYSLGSTKWSSGPAITEAESDWMEFYWWDIESATSLATGLTLFAILLM